jgi:hypothetical protein
MSHTFPLPSPLGLLDVALAERMLAGGMRGQRLMAARRQRDHRWIAGVLGGRGVYATEADVEAALAGMPGRFLPGQPEFELIRGLRRAIDHIERRAEYGATPDGPGIRQVFDLSTAQLGRLVWHALRDSEPWEMIGRLRYPRPEYLADLLVTFDEPHCYHDDPVAFPRLHPVLQAARVLYRFVRISPFRDYNLVTGSLAASWHLLAKGYPPFLPQTSDRPAMRSVLAGPLDELQSWFARIVLVGFRAVGI